MFLSVQLATAAYACTIGVNVPAEQPSMDAMVSCADMAEQDAAQDNGEKAFCMGHCQADTKYADHAVPQIPAFIPVLAGIIIEPPVLDATPVIARHAHTQPRAPPPPHAILHCCFRT